MDFHRLINKYKAFGGRELVREYARLGLIGPILKAFLKCLFRRRSFKAVYGPVLKKVEPALVARYDELLKSRIKEYRKAGMEHTHSRKIWFCWLQGMDKMPDIVRACWNSLHRHLGDREIVFIDSDNWREFVELPDYVQQKWAEGKIPAALFSDLLRLELLTRYGGAWIDSSVLCTGGGQSYLLDADLFLFQYTKPDSDVFGGVSNWFISAVSAHPLLLALRDVLYAYWRDYDCTLDYYMFHLFFGRIQVHCPEEIAGMPYEYSPRSLALMHNWGERFDEARWDRLTGRVAFHKLSNRPGKKVCGNPDNYYNEILRRYA